jgi:phospholipid transport system substrate-binding protein
MGIRAWLVATCAILMVASGAGAEESATTKVVDRLDASLLDVLRQAETLGYKGRLDRLTPALEAAYDLDFMAEKCLGQRWKDLSDQNRAQWLHTFKMLTLANYAARFDHFSGQTFTRLGEEPGANGTVLVRTRVTNPGEEDVELTYRLRETDRGWKIIDVYLKGTVSELALRRSEYSSVLERDGFAALVSSVDAKIADLAAGNFKR